MKGINIFYLYFLLLNISFHVALGSRSRCSYTENGIKKTFSCGEDEHCCFDTCCANVLSFYRLWYFWFFILLMLSLCSGGGYYYKSRLIQQQVVMQPTSTTQSNTTTVMPLYPGQLQSYTPGTRQNVAHVAPDGTVVYTAPPGPPPSYESIHCPVPTYDQWMNSQAENNEASGGADGTRAPATGATNRNKNQMAKGSQGTATNAPPEYRMRPYTITTQTTIQDDYDSVGGGLF